MLETHKLFGKIVHGLADDGALKCLGHSVKHSLLVVFDQLLLVRIFGLGFVLLGSSELSDQIKTLFFAFEHHVLSRSAADQSLEQDDGHTFPVGFFPFKEWHIVVNF